MIEELVNKLAELQTERAAREIVADKESAATDLMIHLAEENIATLKEDRKNERQIDENAIGKMDAEIEEIEKQIVEAWSGEKKTMQFDAGTLKFRTTKSLKIGDGAALLAQLLHHFSTNVIVDEYISGFNRTAIKKFMDLIPTLPDVAELIPKTNVKLEQKE